ncbi:sirohydrochlorin chelatase [Bacillus sp. B1-b2]|uniref:sirohydrochlorin chelatase n=1 Tax=Bacillus sp. B1-b2 TaxID=2653201 RepID=UPI0012621329|nr:sirohydrochlorin chelatase [Bacillus sp. B1-b2]KAB7668862.1 sirohydrochlorin chelatase [Bacillus sp. B1-b2]
MEAILYVCHGSRIVEASNQAIAFIKKLMQINEFEGIQEYSFLELSEPSIEEGFRKCVEQGATTIHVLPVLLLTAAHAKKDIPEVLARLQLEYPSISLNYGKPIGVHPKMIEILAEKMKEAELYQNLEKETLVLLVGRGSSDPDVKDDLGKIAFLMEEYVPNVKVWDCYLTAAQPSFEEALFLANESSYQKIVVIPYLLFTGILMKSMEKTIKEWQSDDKKFELLPYLGYHPNIAEILKERIQEMRMGDINAVLNG